MKMDVASMQAPRVTVTVLTVTLVSEFDRNWVESILERACMLQNQKVENRSKDQSIVLNNAVSNRSNDASKPSV